MGNTKARGPLAQVLADHDCRFFVLGSTFSTFGDRAMFLAAAIWVRVLTGSNAEAGLTFMFLILPQVLAAPLAGMLADRMRRRSLLIVTNLCGAGVVLLLVLVTSRADVWLIFLVMGLYGALDAVLSAGQSALLVTMVPSDRLGDANGLLQTLAQGLRLVTPLVGAGLFVAFGGRSVAELDAGTFLLAATFLALLRMREPKPEPAPEHWLTETTAGFRHIWRTAALRQLLVALLLALTVFGFMETAVFAVVTAGLHRGASFVGVLISVQGVGAVGGGVSSATALRRLGEAAATALGMVGMAVGALTLVAPAWLGGAPALATCFLGSVVFGFGLPWVLVGSITLIQRRTPLKLQGRVDAAFGVLFGGLQSASIGLGALLVGRLGFVAPLLAVTVVVSLAAVYLYRSSGEGGGRATLDLAAPDVNPSA